ncbi:hypothetical protein [Nocardia huaxiensis]|uniref:Uncharacterized protein n=1 Tax=Nocardia huaxiensis TaxID=2755382 RepID=A0A7D6VJ53_9NOCA|nr:hypothetical protein [Nocardia huaxiensis]QLY31236.1 hypothetical protein H0264_02355 [Nocardia huaxiensis]UFS94775.1 hypothetical protein LPY97_29185 [Nocardia huaxiensis]
MTANSDGSVGAQIVYDARVINTTVQGALDVMRAVREALRLRETKVAYLSDSESSAAITIGPGIPILFRFPEKFDPRLHR